MWYVFRKMTETKNSILYAYGFESEETTGQFEYDKSSEETRILKFSDKHTEEVRNIKHFNFTVYKLIHKYGAPDERMIAYG